LDGVPNALVFVGGVTIDPKNPSTVYVTKFLTGVYKSTDGGASWRAANLGMPTNPTGFPTCCVSPALIDPQNPNTLYAAGVNSTSLTMYRTTNAGLSWSAIGSVAQAFVIGPQGALYAAGAGGLIKSADGGATWSPVNFGFRPDPVGLFAIDPRSSTTLYAGGRKSTDGGMSWFAANAGIQGGMVALAIDPQAPDTLYTATDV
jgi:photosystem II stability/assembly factor-like uncharacterized protein